MKTRSMEVRDRILFILGMSLCGVFVFVLVVGVIVSMITSWDGKKRTETIDSASIQEDEDWIVVKAKSNGQRKANTNQFHQ